MYDIAVIGAGWAGFNAALRARQLGLKVCLIDAGPIGGVCLNAGCIPTKALIQSAKVFSCAKKTRVFGVQTAEPVFDFAAIQSRKNAVVRQLQAGMKFLLKEIPFIATPASFVSAVELKAGDDTLQARHVVIATGSRPVELPGLPFDGARILSSDDILNLAAVPASLLIIGGGVIGCEFASLFAALGTRVAIVEKMPQILPGEDKDVARKIETIFKKKGIAVMTNADAAAVNRDEFEKTLVCAGRRAHTQGLNADAAGVKLEDGRVVVDAHLRSSAPGIFAAGDCAGKAMLAHYAAYQGGAAAENIAGRSPPANAEPACVPNCIFTDPEIAGVGMTEETARAAGYDPEVHKSDFQASGMARILDETEGFLKIVSERSTGAILGAAVIGPHAVELIGILTVAVSCSLTLAQLKNTVFAHPTLSESIGTAFR